MTKKAFDRKALAGAIEKQRLAEFEAALSEALTVEQVDQIVGLMERCGRLFFRAADPKKEARRDAFLNGAADALERRAGTPAGEQIRAVLALARQVEGGYRDVAHGLASAEISALPLDRQINAVLDRAVIELDLLRKRSPEVLGKSEFQVMGEPLYVRDGDGQAHDLDVMWSAWVEKLGSCLKLLTSRAQPDRPRGPVVLPPRARATEEDVYKAGTSFALAIGLQRWRTLEERCRFWGGDLIEHRPPNMMEGAAGTIEVIREHRRKLGDVFDFIANERLKDVFQRQWDDFQRKPPPSPYVGDAGTATLDDYLSHREAASAQALAGLMSKALFASGQRFCGLTLREWLRGYAVLNLAAEAAAAAGETPEARALVSFEPGELEARLERLGLPADAAQTFVGLVTFGDHSEDMFDCPLLTTAEGGHLLFAPACENAVLGRVVLSNLSALKDPFAGKGEGFEAEVLGFFRARGFDAYAIDAKVGDEPYQLDVLVPWGNFLFVFECKHENLSASRPPAAYNFAQHNLAHIAQIRRQVLGLRQHPHLSTEAGGPDPRRCTIVPVVLHAFPFALPGDHDGVYVSDWSSVSRFFGPRTICFISRHDAGEGEVLEAKHAVHSFWANDLPAPEDLVRQLKDPIQLRLNLERFEARSSPIYLCDHRGALTVDYLRRPTDTAARIKAAGGDPKRIREDMDKHEREARSRRKGKSHRKLRAEARAWREAKRRRQSQRPKS